MAETEAATVGQWEYYVTRETDRIRELEIVEPNVCAPDAPLPPDGTGADDGLRDRDTTDIVTGSDDGNSTVGEWPVASIANIIERARELSQADAGNVGTIADAGIRLEINRRMLASGEEQLYGIYRRRGKGREFYRYLGTKEKVSQAEPERLSGYLSRKRERVSQGAPRIPTGG